MYREGGRRQWPVYYNSPQSFMTTFSYSLALGTFISRFIKLSVKTFQPIIVIYRRANFVYYYWGCTSIIGHCLIPLDPWWKRQFIWDVFKDSFKARFFIVVKLLWTLFYLSVIFYRPWKNYDFYLAPMKD